jgi:superfamily II DNA or RNA helicase
MILDNQNKNLKVHEWITENTNEGEFDIVTGYFTIGALAFLSDKTNIKISAYRFVIGDIVANADGKVKALDLLNENITIDTAFQIKAWAVEAVQFLKQSKVTCKTLEPNFCHAKLYVTRNVKNNPMKETYIMGSSNLTEAGIGYKPMQNVELNTAGSGADSIYPQLKDWFEDLWHKPQASLIKTIKDENGIEHKVDFKQYLIDEISKIFKVYAPLDIYEKMLFELFKTPDKDENFAKDLGKLENSKVYHKLFEFQKLGVINLIKMLNTYNGAILADAVGLGKTWTALAVIKFYQFKGHETIVLAPKRLEHNWKQYQRRQNSLFEEDNLDYIIKFHTDFTQTNVDEDNLQLDFIINDKPKLIVIDESHNLRNDKSIKYQILVQNILQKCKGDIKVLLLSATPINNSFKDVRNQFALMCRANNNGFEELLGVKNLEHTFRAIQKEYNTWQASPQMSLSHFYTEIKESDFFKLTENLVVARTRKAIKQHFDNNIQFPKHLKPININKTPIEFADVEDFTQLMDNLKLNLSAYQPTQFTFTKVEVAKLKTDKHRDVTADNTQREYFLVKMMKILLLKRLESSWKSFYITVCRIYEHHEKLLNKINDYQKDKKDLKLSDDAMLFDELYEDLADYEVGKKNPIKISEIDRVGRLDEYKQFLKTDKASLRYIKDNVADFEKEFNQDYKKDVKLVELLKIIDDKKKSKNKKLIIFTTYTDTAQYIYDQLVHHGYDKLGIVFGGGGKTCLQPNAEQANNNIENILQHFAPYTKLYNEKKWDKFNKNDDAENYTEWLQFIQEHHPRIFNIANEPIDILVTTDVLSEGQNLQDADMVINYDVHWNPVRIIQRFGRIDRIGSPNKTIQLVNFWPANDIESYIKLKSRVEDRMNVMHFMGSEVIDQMTPDIEDTEDIGLDERQTNTLLKQMQNSLEDLDGEKSLGFDDFSFDNYRQELHGILIEKNNQLNELPNGIFSGCQLIDATLPAGIIALLGVQPKVIDMYRAHELIYIGFDGQLLSNNQKYILEILTQHKNEIRFVPNAIDNGKANAIQQLQQLLANWVTTQNTKTEEAVNGNTIITAGMAQLAALQKLQKGDKKIIAALQKQENIFEKKYELITWLLVSK